MTFSGDGFTLTGTDPVSAVITLQSLGVNAVGCNCSLGPDSMLDIIKKIKPYSKLPLIAKPNAGLPKLVNGETVYEMTSDEFAGFTGLYIEAGVNLIGGCCGTDPEYIKKIAAKARNKKPVLPAVKSISAVSSARKYLLLDRTTGLKIVGERINPTGKKDLQAELKEGSLI